MDMLFILLAEVLYGRDNRIGDCHSKAAYGSLLDGIGQFEQDLNISGLSVSSCNVLQDLEHLLCAEPARSTLPTGFILSKIEEVPGDIHNTRTFIHDEHSPGAND